MVEAPPRVNADLLDWDDYVTYYGGKPYTGVAYELRPDGSLWSEQKYSLGLLDGRSCDWYPSGALRSETFFKLGVANGPSREWHPSGQMKSEKILELGYCVASREWDEQGRLVQEHTADDLGANFELLRNARAREPQRVDNVRKRLGSSSVGLGGDAE